MVLPISGKVIMECHIMLPQRGLFKELLSIKMTKGTQISLFGMPFVNTLKSPLIMEFL